MNSASDPSESANGSETCHMTASACGGSVEFPSHLNTRETVDDTQAGVVTIINTCGYVGTVDWISRLSSTKVESVHENG